MSQKTIACHACETHNHADYTFCYHCRHPPKAPDAVTAEVATVGGDDAPAPKKRAPKKAAAKKTAAKKASK